MSVHHYLPEQIFDGVREFSHTSISVANGKVVAIGGYEREAEYLAGIVVPGFVDIQVNGGGGVLFNDAPNVAALQTISKAHQRFGSTSILPTVITDSVQVREQAADAIAQALKEKLPGIIGVHFEGPHISEHKRGVHAPELIAQISDNDMALYQRKDIGVKLTTFAPETVSAEQIQALVAQQVICSVGHSNASAEQTQSALQHGATGFTHLFNAMSGLTGRNPGVIGAALLDEHSYAGVIADGVHVSTINLQLAVRCKGVKHLILVTDAMPPLGADREAFLLYGQPVRKEGMILKDVHGALAGSVLDLCSAIRHMVELVGVHWHDAVRMASFNPATFIGVHDRKGHLRVGADADMVLLSKDWCCQKTWIGGEVVHAAKNASAI